MKFLTATSKFKKNSESTQDPTSVDPNTNPTESTQSPLQLQNSSYSETFTEQAQSSSLEM